jgi:aspartate/methionine/tyrosine aminotransferase
LSPGCTPRIYSPVTNERVRAPDLLGCLGTYFLNIDLGASGLRLGDVTSCERLVAEFGVETIPVSAFYADDLVSDIVRLCFAKQDVTLDAAIERMTKAHALLSG